MMSIIGQVCPVTGIFAFLGSLTLLYVSKGTADYKQRSISQCMKQNGMEEL